MSGHSKWSTIKHKKGAADAKRGQLFTKLTREITVAAREGSDDPDMNFRLRLAIDNAKSQNMPKDTIERAVAKGAGKGADGNALEELTYEAYGPGGTGFIIQTLTDNRNRAARCRRQRNRSGLRRRCRRYRNRSGLRIRHPLKGHARRRQPRGQRSRLVELRAKRPRHPRGRRCRP
jgi:hypothetical protein